MQSTFLIIRKAKENKIDGEMSLYLLQLKVILLIDGVYHDCWSAALSSFIAIALKCVMLVKDRSLCINTLLY